MSTRIKLPKSIRYPVELVSLLVPEGGSVVKNQPLLKYKYSAEVEEGNGAVSKQFFSTFESPAEGVVDQWHVAAGETLTDASHDVVSVIEDCTHAVQFGGLCAICGKQIDDKDYNDFSNESRAPIAMSHDTAGLKVSRDEAQKIERSSAERLLKERKLILVVDLDQTVIHAAVDPTIGEWMRDPSNPNFDALKDVETFNLKEEVQGSQGSDSVWCYYVKLRPGLKEFLANMAQLYEMHIYTMATKAYARSIAKLIDPDERYFGDRILSRDESGSLMQKSLERLFPVDTSMVTIIDDRGDVWKWSANLVKAVPYNFFVGVGDINSSFLPQNTGVVEKSTPKAPDSKANETKPVVDQLIAIGDESEFSTQASEHTANLEQQQQERPLAKLQEQVNEDKLAVENGAESSEDPIDTEVSKPKGSDSVTESEHDKDQPLDRPRHRILSDDDDELKTLELALRRIHDQFYRQYNEDSAQFEAHQTNPDLKDIIPQLKRQVFEGCVFLFSGVLPVGVRIETADIVQWVRSFGASVVSDYSEMVTHVITASSGTRKVYEATRDKWAKIVYKDWVFACLREWRRVDEKDFEVIMSDEDFRGYERMDNNDRALESDSEFDGVFVRSLSASNVNWEDLEKEVEDAMTSDDEEEDEDDQEKEGDDGEGDDGEGDGRQEVVDDEQEDTRKHGLDHTDDTDDTANKRSKTLDDDTSDEDDLFAMELEKNLQN